MTKIFLQLAMLLFALLCWLNERKEKKTKRNERRNDEEEKLSFVLFGWSVFDAFIWSWPLLLSLHIIMYIYIFPNYYYR